MSGKRNGRRTFTSPLLRGEREREREPLFPPPRCFDRRWSTWWTTVGRVRRAGGSAIDFHAVTVSSIRRWFDPRRCTGCFEKCFVDRCTRVLEKDRFARTKCNKFIVILSLRASLFRSLVVSVCSSSNLFCKIDNYRAIRIFVRSLKSVYFIYRFIASTNKMSTRCDTKNLPLQIPFLSFR